jgi:hypothetical protein
MRLISTPHTVRQLGETSERSGHNVQQLQDIIKSGGGDDGGLRGRQWRAWCCFPR